MRHLWSRVIAGIELPQRQLPQTHGSMRDMSNFLSWFMLGCLQESSHQWRHGTKEG